MYKKGYVQRWLGIDACENDNKYAKIGNAGVHSTEEISKVSQLLFHKLYKFKDRKSNYEFEFPINGHE